MAKIRSTCAATEEEAAEAYDIAAIKFRGINAVTNFEMNRYDVEAISQSPLPIGGAAKRMKLSLEAEEKLPLQTPCIQPPFYHHNLFHHLDTANLGVSNASASISTMVAPEFYIWPHQSY